MASLNNGRDLRVVERVFVTLHSPHKVLCYSTLFIFVCFFICRQEALLMRQMKERRRAVYEGDTYKPLEREVCEHVSDDVRCTDLVLPLTKYCLKRILCLKHI